MKNLLKIFIVPLLALCLAAGCAGSKGAESAPQFVTVRDGEFYIGDSLYRLSVPISGTALFSVPKSMATATASRANLTI